MKLTIGDAYKDNHSQKGPLPKLHLGTVGVGKGLSRAFLYQALSGSTVQRKGNCGRPHIWQAVDISWEGRVHYLLSQV